MHADKPAKKLDSIANYHPESVAILLFLSLLRQETSIKEPSPIAHLGISLLQIATKHKVLDHPSLPVLADL